MIIGQVFYLVNSRFLLESCFSFRALTGNPLIPAAIGGVIMLQALFTYAPFMHQIFGSESLPLWIWKWLLLGGIVFFIVVELEKVLVRLVYPRVKTASDAHAFPDRTLSQSTKTPGSLKQLQV